jgi:hypothetical protein
MGEENSYTPAAPQGVEAKIFENLAASNWQLARTGSDLRPSACLGLGLGLGGPWATLGPPKGHARATQAWRKRRFA